MKSSIKTLSVLLSFLCVSLSYGQAIKVDASGIVGIGGNPESPYALKVNGSLRVSSSIRASSLALTSQNIYALSNSSLRIEALHIGISSSPDASSTLKVAGESNTYALKVEGEVLSLAGYYVVSDGKLKKNIEDLDKKAMLEKVLKLQSKSYYFKDSTELKELHNQGFVRFQYDTTWTTDKATGKENIEVRLDIPRYPQSKQIGLIAEDVEILVPEIVMTDSVTNLKAINYTKVVPLLIEAIKEQQSQIDELTYLISEIYDGSSKKSLQTPLIDSYLDDKGLYPMLYQNNPNPFNESTVIKYQLPENTNSAIIVIYDMTGKQLRNIPLTEDRESSIKISAGELDPGMYMYSMIVENRLVDTKQMILTE